MTHTVSLLFQDDEDHIDASIPHLTMRDRMGTPPQETSLPVENEVILAQYSDRQEAGVPAELEAELPAHGMEPQDEYMEPQDEYMKPQSQFTEPHSEFTEPHLEYTEPHSQYIEPHSEEILTEDDDDVSLGWKAVALLRMAEKLTQHIP